MRISRVEVVQLFANPRELAGGVVVDRAAHDSQEPLLRHRQPVRDGKPVDRVAAELCRQPVREWHHVHVMPDGNGVPAERDRPTAVLRRETGVDRRTDGRDVGRVDEDLQARSPAVVGRAFRVEAEQLGSVAEQRGGVRPRVYERADDIAIEACVQLEGRNELGTHPDIPTALLRVELGDDVLAEQLDRVHHLFVRDVVRVRAGRTAARSRPLRSACRSRCNDRGRRRRRRRCRRGSPS